MGKKLYVGSLAYSINDQTLESIFSSAGTVESANVIMDKHTGQSKGFGFVEMATDEEAKNAISTLNGTTQEGRAIVVNEARPQEPRSGGFGGRGGNGGGFGGRGGNGGGFGGGRGGNGGGRGGNGGGWGR